MKNQPVQSLNTMLKETSQPENKVAPASRVPDTGGSLDTGQPQTSTEEQTNENNSTGYNFNLSNRLLLDNDMDDIDSTDDMDDMDDHHQAMGDAGYNANLTGLANNAAMFIEDDKRKRRAIANSNERRRMQSINAGFQTLKSLIPHSSGEKLSKACILQRSADFMQFLSNEKDKLSTKLTAAFKILESNGLMDQLNEKASSETRSGTAATSASFTSTSGKPSATTKINKQYVSAYNSAPLASKPATATGSSLLSSALADCTNDLKKTQQCSESSQQDNNRNLTKQQKSSLINSTAAGTSTSTSVMPVKSLTTTIARTQFQPTTSDFDSASKTTGSESSNSAQPTLITPIQLATPIQCTNPTEINLLLNNSGITRIISSNNTETNVISSPPTTDSTAFEAISTTNDIPNMLVPCNESQLVSPPLNVQCIQIDLNNPAEENNKETRLTENLSNTKVTTNDLVALLNGIKATNPNMDISSMTNLILKSIISSNKLDNMNLLDPGIQTGLAEILKKQNTQLNVDTNSQQTDLNVLLSSLQQQPQTTTNNSKASAEPLTNNHLQNASILASKSSRSNSIDQLIAAAAVTAHGSTCMSPLSPSNSPTGSSHKANDASQTAEDAANELTVSRKNLNTIVEAIFHVEGASRMDELVDYNEIAKQQKYQNSLPSSSYTASSSGMSTQQKEEVQQQQKPPKKRKYTTEDITQTQEDPQQSTPAKQSNQFISEYYNSSSGKAIEQCQSINRILAKSGPVSSSGSTSNKTPKKSGVSTNASGSGSGSSSSDENISTKSEQKKSSSNLVGLLITS